MVCGPSRSRFKSAILKIHTFVHCPYPYLNTMRFVHSGGMRVGGGVIFRAKRFGYNYFYILYLLTRFMSNSNGKF